MNLKRIGRTALLAVVAGSAAAGADEAPSICQRETLLGDLGGLRPKLEARGFTFGLTYTFENLWNAHGGLKSGGAFRSDLTLEAELDTEKAGWWKGGGFGMKLQAGIGNGLTANYTGDFQTLSNIDVRDFAQVSELWYRHQLLDEKLTIKFGKLDTSADFGAPEYGGDFINSSAAVNPTMPMATYPDSDLGLVIGITPCKVFELGIGVYQGRPNGSRSLVDAFTQLGGPLAVIEPRFHFDIRKHPGTIRVGGWWNGDTFASLRNTDPEPPAPSDPFTQLDLYRGVLEIGLGQSYLEALRQAVNEEITTRIVNRLIGHDDEQESKGTFGLYLTWDQQIYKENKDDEKDEQGVGMFLQAGWNAGDVREVKEYAGLGVAWTGAIPKRDSDVVGLGVFHARFNGAADSAKPHETAIELFYSAQVTPWFSLKPDLQYIVNPGGSDAKDAFAAGFRGEIKF